MKKIVVILVSFLVLSCQKNEAKKAVEKPKNEDCSNKEKKFEMYKMSEMATLMEQMYVDNQNLKERIKKGEKIGKFPQYFLKIHEAVMTDKKENDIFFKQQAALFIKAQELIYNDPKKAKQHFNEGVDACIQCHQIKCGGPIARIKKLYID